MAVPVAFMTARPWKGVATVARYIEAAQVRRIELLHKRDLERAEAKHSKAKIKTTCPASIIATTFRGSFLKITMRGLKVMHHQRPTLV